jgi:subtilisin-like proprotein convertase family protein
MSQFRKFIEAKHKSHFENKHMNKSKLGRAFIFRLVIIGMAFLPLQVFCASQTFSNTNFITILDSENPPTLASVYPSTISVTGQTIQVVSKVTVTLQGLSHEFPSDIGIMLVGPQGQMAVLMSEVGGEDELSVTNLTLTLDDDAANSLPLDTALTSGTFKPTERDHPLLFDFPLPVPAGNSNAPAALSVFQNTDPNGDWNLFVVDDSAGSAGSISNGWSLNLTTTPVSLQIQPADSSHVLISWPSAITNATLQSTTNLLSANWQDVSNMPVIVAGQLVVTNSIFSKQFYRLEE